MDGARREASEATSSIERLNEECHGLQGDLQRQETLIVQKDGAITSLRDEACTQWASGWLAFQRKAANAYPSLDLSFDIPSEEEAEESFSAYFFGDPDTLANAHSPSSPPAPSSDVRSPSHSFAFFFFFVSGFKPGIHVMSFSMNILFSILSLFLLSCQFELLGFWVVKLCKLSC